LTTEVVTGVLLITLPIAYNGLYTLLARTFDYPDILRRPTGEVLERFAAGGSRLVLTWWAFAMSAVLLAPTAVLVSATFANANPALLSVATAIGLLAALVQFLGLIRWPFAVPHLAREMADPTSSASKRESVDVTFQITQPISGCCRRRAPRLHVHGSVDWIGRSGRPAIGRRESRVRSRRLDPPALVRA
jgi:Domain of unknown function (DUF4386)